VPEQWNSWCEAQRVGTTCNWPIRGREDRRNAALFRAGLRRKIVHSVFLPLITVRSLPWTTAAEYSRDVRGAGHRPAPAKQKPQAGSGLAVCSAQIIQIQAILFRLVAIFAESRFNDVGSLS
jgi:hypothetical protein